MDYYETKYDDIVERVVAETEETYHIALVGQPGDITLDRYTVPKTIDLEKNDEPYDLWG